MSCVASSCVRRHGNLRAWPLQANHYPRSDSHTRSASVMPPPLSILMPVYNAARYLRETIESLLAQPYQNYVVLISDNCSTDGSWDILQEYAHRDPRFQLTRQPENAGAYRNGVALVA